MTDRELLERAAKAAGMRVTESGIPGWAFIRGDTLKEGWWSPLTNDGDALRLAVKLRMSLDFYGIDGPQVEANVHGHSACGHGSAPIDGDASKATRRAIVRAAAAMGGK